MKSKVTTLAEDAGIAPKPRSYLLGGLLLWVLYAYFIHFWPHYHTANESIRLYFAQAVLDDGTPTVDALLRRYRSGNVDAARTKDGLTLDKAPGLSYLAMPIYFVASRLGMSTRAREVYRIYYLVSLLLASLLGVGGVFWLAGVVYLLTKRRDAGLLVAAAFALATPFALYSTLFFGHGPATALLCGALYYVLARRPLPAGALAGAMIFVDTSTLLLGVGLGVLLGLRERRVRSLLLFATAALPFAAFQALHNNWLVGSPWVFPYHYKANSAQAQVLATGFYGFSMPSATSLWGLTLGGKRGLFFHAPLLLLGALGLQVLSRSRRLEAIVLALLALLHLLFISGFVDWQAGDSFSARHLLPLTPLLAAGLGGLYASLGDLQPQIQRLLSGSAIALFIYSLVANWAPVATFPYAPVAFSLPIADLSLPLLGYGVLSPSLASWAGISAPWAVMLIFGALLTISLCWLVHRLRQLRYQGPTLSPSTLGLACAGAVLAVGLLWVGRPEPTREGVQTRVLVHCLMRDTKNAAAFCRSAGGRYSSAICRCHISRASFLEKRQ